MSIVAKRFAQVLALVMALLLVGLMTPTAQAADIRSGSTIVIEAGEVIDDDLVVTAERIRIDGTVTGDLIAAGTTVTVNGLVGGSALIVGQSAFVNGTIDGSLYASTYSFELGKTAEIGGNLYYAGYALTTAPGSEVGRSLYFGGYQLAHGGAVGEDLVIAASAVDITGSASGDVRGTVQVTQNGMNPMSFTPNAVPLTPVEPGLRIDPAAIIGGQTVVDERITTADQARAPEPGPFGLPVWFTDRLGEFIGLMLIGALIIYLLPTFLPAVGTTLAERSLPSLGWGLLLMFIVLPVGMIAGSILVILLTLIFGWLTFGQLTGAVLTLTGSFLAFALFAFLFAAYIVAKIVVGYEVGRWILTRLSIGSESTSRWMHVAYLALGAILYEMLRAIPVAGWLVALIVVVLGTGAMFDHWLSMRKVEKTPQQDMIMADES